MAKLFPNEEVEGYNAIVLAKVYSK